MNEKDQKELDRRHGELLDRVNELWAFCAALQAVLEKHRIPRAEIHQEFGRMLELTADTKKKTLAALESRKRLEWLDELLRNAPPTKQ
jgi:hypothetical protein